MSESTMREEFEQAYTKACVERGAGHHIAEVHVSKDASGEYVSVWMRGAWWAWQASRAGLVIDLPVRMDLTGFGDFVFDDDDVIKAIEAAGVKCGVKA